MAFTHAPPRKCWSCAKPMNTMFTLDAPTKCIECSFVCCGACNWEHVRRAHPALYMRRYLPAKKAARVEAAPKQDEQARA